jgi:hypothetical protein
VSPSSTEWSAIVATGGAILGAGVGGTITYLVTGRQIRSTETLAREERTQQRKLEAYRMLTATTMFSQKHMDWTMDLLRSIPSPEPVAPTTTNEIMAHTSLIMSDDVSRIITKMHGIDKKFSATIGIVADAPNEETRQAAVQRASDVVAEFTECAFRLRKQLRSELNLPHDEDRSDQ